jgi:ankyrin repeat protein
MLICCIHGN